MRIIRYQRGKAAPGYGWLLDNLVGELEGDPFGDFRRKEAHIPLEEVRLLAPVRPGKIVCIGRNYVEHVKEQDAEVPEIPILFLKPSTAVIGPGDTISLPMQSTRVDHEAELAVVIGRRGRLIDPERTAEYIFGYTIGNDVTARDLQRRDGQWSRAKGFDTFCPLGPWIETDFDPSDAMITCHVNDELRQMSSTRDMIFSVRQLTAFISSIMTLEPGDVIMTGTPAGIGPLTEGDTVRVAIEGIGELTNRAGLERR